MKRITHLTPQQEALLPVVRDEWLTIGLSTGAPDKTLAEEGLRDAYEAAGLTPPRIVIWLDSPLAGVIGQAIAPHIITNTLTRHGQVYDQVHGQVDGQVRGQVYDQVDAQVYGQVYDQVDGQVYGQVYDQVRAQVDGQVEAQVGGQVYDQVYDQVDGQVYGQVDDQVYGQVYGQVGDQVRAQVYSQVDGQVRGQVYGQVYGQVDGQVYDQVDGQVRGQVYDQVRDQVDGQVYDQVDNQVRDQVYDQVYRQVYGQVRGQVDGQVYDQVYDQVRGQVDGQISLGSWWKSRLWGQWNAGYYSWLDAHDRIGVTGLDPIQGQQKIARAGVGMYWVYRGFAVLTPRSLTLHRDAMGRLHREDGPAMEWADGWAIHAWHGTRVPASLVSGDGWTPQQIMDETNAEVRRCAIERMGWDRFLTHLGAEPVASAPDPGNPGFDVHLYDLPAQMQDTYDAPARLYVCTNGTVERDGTRRRFALPVPAHHTDPIEAGAELYGWPVEAYRRLEVRR